MGVKNIVEGVRALLALCSYQIQTKLNFQKKAQIQVIEITSYTTKTMMLSIGLILISILGLSCLSSSIFKQQDQALAQQYIPTIKYRNLVIDLGNGVKTNAQLTYPAIGKGPFPGVLLIHGSGAYDKNETSGFVHNNGPKPPTPFCRLLNIYPKEALQYYDMIREVLVQILHLIRTYGEMLQSMISYMMQRKH